MDDPSVESNKKTFLKAQIPKMENEIKNTKSRVKSLLEAEELDPRGEWYVLAKKLMKQRDKPCGEVLLFWVPKEASFGTCGGLGR